MPLLNQHLVPGVVGINPPAKEVEAEPPALVLDLRLIAQQGCAERLPEVLGLDQLCIWPDGAGGSGTRRGSFTGLLEHSLTSRHSYNHLT
jgi:hypothetical protein